MFVIIMVAVATAMLEVWVAEARRSTWWRRGQWGMEGEGDGGGVG